MIRWPSLVCSNSKNNNRFQWDKSKKAMSSSEVFQMKTKCPNSMRFAREKTVFSALKYSKKSAGSKELKILILKVRRFLIPMRRSSAFSEAYSMVIKLPPNTCWSTWSLALLREHQKVWHSDNSTLTLMVFPLSRLTLSKSCSNTFFFAPSISTLTVNRWAKRDSSPRRITILTQWKQEWCKCSMAPAS